MLISFCREALGQRSLYCRHVKSYRLDLYYQKGVHGFNIGADASDK